VSPSMMVIYSVASKFGPGVKFSKTLFSCNVNPSPSGQVSKKPKGVSSPRWNYFVGTFLASLLRCFISSFYEDYNDETMSRHYVDISYIIMKYNSTLYLLSILRETATENPRGFWMRVPPPFIAILAKYA